MPEVAPENAVPQFGGPHPVGGVGSREDLFRAYEAAGGRPVEPERLLGQVAVLDGTAAVVARQPGQSVAREPLSGVPNGLLVVVGDGVTVGRLVAGQPQRVQ